MGNKRRLAYARGGATDVLHAWLVRCGAALRRLLLAVSQTGAVVYTRQRSGRLPEPASMNEYALYLRLQKRAKEAGVRQFSLGRPAASDSSAIARILTSGGALGTRATRMAPTITNCLPVRLHRFMFSLRHNRQKRAYDYTTGSPRDFHPDIERQFSVECPMVSVAMPGSARYYTNTTFSV